MAEFGLLLVEGPHDVEFIYRLLTPFGFKRIQFAHDLDDDILPLVRQKFPPTDGDFLRRIPVPLFIKSPELTIAIRSVGGDSKLVATLEGIKANPESPTFRGVGIILDSDRNQSPRERFLGLKSNLESHDWQVAENPGEVTTSTNETGTFGVFVLPDNQSPGNLENILLECAQAVYPNLLESATTHVDNAKNDKNSRDGKCEDLDKPQNYNKAVVSSIATVLKLGRAVQTSIQDNRWLRGENLNIPSVKNVQDFLVSLFNLNPITNSNTN